VGSYPKKENYSLTISLILAVILSKITKLHAKNINLTQTYKIYKVKCSAVANIINL
jgi:hypothetical protein